jgi:hypothetical protein
MATLQTRATWLAVTATAGSIVGYWYAGFHLSNVVGPAKVYLFLWLFGGLFALYALGVLGLAGRRDAVKGNGTIWLVLSVGVFFRLLMLPAGISDGVTFAKLESDLTGEAVVFDRFLLFDHDLWRFLWDGHQQAVGMNPYQYPPSHFSEDIDLEAVATDESEVEKRRLDGERVFLDDRWRDIFANLNHKELPTLYPPGMQFCFYLSHLVAPGSVLVWKSALILADLATAALIWAILNKLRLPHWRLALYFWNPLVIKESIGSGHADVFVALMLVGLALALARERPVEIGVWFAGAVVMKIAPLILLPFLIKKMKASGCLAAGFVIGVACAPFLRDASLAGLTAYSQEWVFNPGVFELFRWTALRLTPLLDPTASAKIACGATLLALLFLFRKRLALHGGGMPDALLLIQGGLLFFSPTVMPWYFIWITPLAAISGARAWIAYGALSMLSYLIYADGSGVEPALRLLIIHCGFLAFWILEQTTLRVTPKAETATA